jgi:hypothetical protein
MNYGTQVLFKNTFVYFVSISHISFYFTSFNLTFAERRPYSGATIVSISNRFSNEAPGSRSITCWKFLKDSEERGMVKRRVKLKLRLLGISFVLQKQWGGGVG